MRYLYSPGEVEGGHVRRSTDPYWSTRIYEVERMISTNPPVYYLRDPKGQTEPPKRAFTREELQIVPFDTVVYST